MVNVNLSLKNPMSLSIETLDTVMLSICLSINRIFKNLR